MNRKIKFFLKTPYKSMTRRGIIPQGVMFWRIFHWLARVYPGESIRNLQNMTPQGIILRRVSLTGVWYPRESILPGFHTLGSHGTKLFIRSPRGRILQRVKLTGVGDWLPGYQTPGRLTRRGMRPCESLKTQGVNSHFLKHLHRQIKRQWHKNNSGLLFFY